MSMAIEVYQKHMFVYKDVVLIHNTYYIITNNI
jgi:hypothetical protein